MTGGIKIVLICHFKIIRHIFLGHQLWCVLKSQNKLFLLLLIINFFKLLIKKIGYKALTRSSNKTYRKIVVIFIGGFYQLESNGNSYM